MEVFTEKIGGKYCPSFKFGDQSFRLHGCDTDKESEWMEGQLKACFSNYGLHISKKISSQLMTDAIDKLNGMVDETINKIEK